MKILLILTAIAIMAFLVLRRLGRSKRRESRGSAEGREAGQPGSRSGQSAPKPLDASRTDLVQSSKEDSDSIVDPLPRGAALGPVMPWSTQFAGSGGDTRPPVDAVLGLDFGTSSTKVVIQNPTLASGRAVAVPFNNLSHPSTPYLLPTTLFFESDDKFTLDESSGGLAVEEIKVRLMEHPAEREAVIWCGAYLALAIREARTWFLNSQYNEIGNRRLRWSMNLGIPSAGYDDDEVALGFRRAASLAWRLSLAERSIDIQLAHDFEGMDVDPEIDLVVVPEVAAEVVGYARSPRRRNGLHVLMDVGATTLDVCSFVLDERDGADRYNLLTAIVSELGARKLHLARIDALQKADIQVHPGVLKWEDYLAPIPDKLDQYVVNGTIPQKLMDANESFQGRSVTPLMTTLVDLKRTRDPNSAALRDGLPIFLCGGGSQMLFYQSVVTESNRRFTAAYAVGRLVPMSLGKPSNLINQDVDDVSFSRLAVAYGLSFDSLDIGEIQRPSEIEDIAIKTARSTDDRFVSKDQV